MPIQLHIHNCQGLFRRDIIWKKRDDQVDVLICGSGSAGICTAAYLARCGISCRILESRKGPLQIGQADGVQCRTVEVFESFGLAENLLRESYHVIEDSFWSTDEDGSLVRTRVAGDTAPNLSHMPHVILNQARLHDFLIDAMRKWHGQEIEYGMKVVDVKVDGETAKDPESYAVRVTATENGQDRIIRAKYVLGCDGAHSTVRRSLGFKMLGDSTDSIWGVMDVYPQTNFPDIRKKVIIRANMGSLLIIPREGGSLVRFYIELKEGTVAKDVTLDILQSTARLIFQPFQMDFADTFWWSAYSIGQRHADFFSQDNRVFLAGDACHTHSPKAGQGMNTSLQDGYNIGWKLVSVLKRHASPELLQTYVLERQKVAIDLIQFDREFAKAFSSKSKGDFSDHFMRSGRYTAGFTKKYDQSKITNIEGSNNTVASGLHVGMSFPSRQVVRFCDAKPMQLAKALPADGRWRVLVFGGDAQNPDAISRLNKLGDFLHSGNGALTMYTSPIEDPDSFIEILVVLSGKRLEFEQEQLSTVFRPTTGKWRMRDLHKIYFDDESYNNGHGHAYDFYGIDPQVGAVAIIRPDQYISMVTSIINHKLITDFFAGFALPWKS